MLSPVLKSRSNGKTLRVKEGESGTATNTNTGKRMLRSGGGGGILILTLTAFFCDEPAIVDRRENVQKL